MLAVMVGEMDVLEVRTDTIRGEDDRREEKRREEKKEMSLSDVIIYPSHHCVLCAQDPLLREQQEIAETAFNDKVAAMRYPR